MLRNSELVKACLNTRQGQNLADFRGEQAAVPVEMVANPPASERIACKQKALGGDVPYGKNEIAQQSLAAGLVPTPESGQACKSR